MKWVLRIGGFLLSLIILALLGLLAWGQRKDAGSFHAATEISRPPEQVWPWMREPDKLKSWVSWLVEVRPDPSGSGAVWVMEDKNNGGALMEIHSQPEREEAPRLLVLNTSAPGGFAGHVTYLLTPTSSGTLIEQKSEFQFAMWMAKLFEPLITMSAEKKAKDDLAQLKARVEK